MTLNWVEIIKGVWKENSTKEVFLKNWKWTWKLFKFKNSKKNFSIELNAKTIGNSFNNLILSNIVLFMLRRYTLPIFKNSDSAQSKWRN